MNIVKKCKTCKYEKTYTACTSCTHEYLNWEPNRGTRIEMTLESVQIYFAHKDKLSSEEQLLSDWIDIALNQEK
jgi:hypothetical protein